MSYQDLIICLICLESFIKFCFLLCFYMYCEECFLYYIFIVYDKEKNGFLCLNCCMFNKVEVLEKILFKMVVVKFFINYMIMILFDQEDKECNGVSCYLCFKRERKVYGKFWCYLCSVVLCEVCGEFYILLLIFVNYRIVLL